MNDKNKYQELIRVFESIEIENIETLLFCWESPESGWHHSKDRINIILEGSDSMQYYSHGQLQTVTLHAPALYYCTRNSYLMQKDLNKKSVLASVFYRNMCVLCALIRMAYMFRRRIKIFICIPVTHCRRAVWHC